MKVSMSNALEGIEVTVSAQAASQIDLPSVPALQLGLAGSYDEDAATDLLQETLIHALPGVLREADAQLRVAIQEKILSRMVESRSRTSLHDSSSEVVPAPRDAIIVVYGPSGCGKTTNAEKLRNYFLADTIIDELSEDSVIPSHGRTLILTNHTIPSAIEVLSPDGFTSPQVRRLTFIHFNAAMQELN